MFLLVRAHEDLLPPARHPVHGGANPRCSAGHAGVPPPLTPPAGGRRLGALEVSLTYQLVPG